MKLLLIIGLIICSFYANGQEYADLLKINYAVSSLNSFESSEEGSRIYETGTDISVPITLNDKSVFLTGVVYERFTSKLFSASDYSTVSSFALKVGINHQHKNNIKGTYVLLPKIASDFKEYSTDAFQLGGAAILKKVVSKNKAWRYGAYFNSEFLGPFFVPILGMYYLSDNSRFEVNITAPVSADVNYSLSKRFNAGIAYKGQVRTFRVNDYNGTNMDGYLMRSTSEANAYLRLNATDGWLLHLMIGHTIGRYHRMFDKEDQVTFGMPLTYIGDDRIQLNKDFSDGLLYTVSLFYRFHFKE